ncbi:MAG: glycosyltransferase family 4 protein [Saprospiraceae bacterium]
MLYFMAKHAPDKSYCLFTPKENEADFTLPFQDKPFKTITPNSSFFRSYWRTKGIIKDLIKNKIDIYHGLSHEIPRGLNRTNIKSVVTMHDLIFKEQPHLFPFIDRQIYDNKFRHACENSDKIITVSENTKQDVIRFYNIPEEKIQVNYLMTDPIFYDDKKEELNINLPKDYLLYVGAISPRKNLKTILASFTIKNDFPPLVVVGRGKKYKKELETFIHQNKIKHKIIWLNNIENNSELKAIYQNASLLIYPSIYEGFGMPVLESILSGTPVLTSNISSLPEVGGKFSYYLDNPKDKEEMHHKIEYILFDLELKNLNLIQAQKYVRDKFNPLKLIGELFDIYESL